MIAAKIPVASFAVPFLWLAYFYFVGRYRERTQNNSDNALIVLFFGGMAAGPIALVLFELLEMTPFYRDITSIAYIEDERVIFAYCLFAIGPIEELAKFLIVWLFMFRRKEFASPLDGLSFAIATGVGFAAVENWYYMSAVGEVDWVRALILPFNHLLFSSFWGVGLAFSKFAIGEESSRMVYIALPLSFVYHGLYDYILFSQQVPNLLVLPLIAILWLWVSVALRRLKQPKSLRDAFELFTPRGSTGRGAHEESQ